MDHMCLLSNISTVKTYLFSASQLRPGVYSSQLMEKQQCPQIPSVTKIPIFFKKIPLCGKHHECEPGEEAVGKGIEHWALNIEEAQEMTKYSESKLWYTGGISSSLLGEKILLTR